MRTGVGDTPIRRLRGSLPSHDRAAPRRLVHDLDQFRAAESPTNISGSHGAGWSTTAVRPS